ncbi:hypothetical protein QBC39DRAFT_158026 [Podospora conica]|nr:hypothetical protein QBC39DRAFT_158026 [Schizothecium conicum]
MSANMNHDSDLLDAFRGAALSVTKLYKIASQHLAKTRADGYQDCLDDLILFLDKESFRSPEDAAKVRRWAAERLEGRETISQSLESEDEVDNKPEAASSPVVMRASIPPQQPPAARYEVQMKDHSPPAAAAAPAPPTPIAEMPPVTFPSRDVFTFQSNVPYPQDISLDALDLSDSQQSHRHPSMTAATPTSTSVPLPTPRHPRTRNGRAPPRGTAARMAGQKRKVNLDEIFDVGSLPHVKDVFGNNKRSRLN